MASNRRKQDEVKQNAIWTNSVKREAHIIKLGRLFDDLLSIVSKILSATMTTDNSTVSVLQDIKPLSFDTLKYDFFYFGGNIRNLPDLQKQMAAVVITRSWNKDIIE